jgi:hypothetical protein
MNENLLPKYETELNKILKLRIPPICWDLAGYLFGFIVLIQGTFTSLMLYGICFASYGMLNAIFDIFTVSIELTNNLFSNYENLGFYKWTIVNKKYNLKLPQQNSRTSLTDNLKTINTSDSNLKIEFSLYVGSNELLELLLNCIYLSGITKKNYTQINRTKMIKSPINFDLQYSAEF